MVVPVLSRFSRKIAMPTGRLTRSLPGRPLSAQMDICPAQNGNDVMPAAGAHSFGFQTLIHGGNHRAQVLFASDGVTFGHCHGLVTQDFCNLGCWRPDMANKLPPWRRS